MNNPLSISQQVHFTRGRRGRPKIRSGEKPAQPEAPLSPSIPRVSRLMALAIHFEQLIRDDVVADYADLARLGRVTRARVTQIMNLLNLAPDIQEELLFLQPTRQGRAVLTEKQIRPITSEMDWRKQRRMLRKMNVN